MSEIQQLTPLGHAFAGALGGVLSNSVVYPLDTAKTVIQATRTDKKGKGRDHPVRLRMVSLLRRIYREEGISGFYKGYAATMLNTFSTQYAYFFFYSFVRSKYIKRIASKLPAGSSIPALSTAAELLLGAVAGALAQIFTIPVSVIAVRQQLAHASLVKPSSSQPGARVQAGGSVNSFTEVAKQIIAEDGVTGLWRGLKPSLVLTVNPAITYGVFERVKSILAMRRGTTKFSPWTAFFIGAFSKSLATVVTYPYIMAKVRIQAGLEREETNRLPISASDKGNKEKEKGALSILSDVYDERGLSGWYQGMGPQILKAVLTQAILFVSKQQIELYSLLLLNMYARLRRRAST